jgi:hypothetical protein
MPVASKTNLQKTQVYPIKFEQPSLNFLNQTNLDIDSFPCSYLVLPIHIKKLPKHLLLNLVHKVANCLPGWKKNLLTYPCRELLVKMVLSAVPTFFLIVHKLPK